MKYEKISIPILILFCLFIYPVIFKGPVVLSYAYQYGIPLYYVILNNKLIKKVTKRQLFILVLSVILLLLSYVYPSFHNTGDYTYIKVSTFVFRKLIIYLFLIIVLVKKYKEKASLELFMYYYTLTHAVFVIGTILLVFIPGFKTFWFSVFMELFELEGVSEAYGYTFRIGWQGFAGYRMTLHCTWCCIFLLYMFYGSCEDCRLKNSTFFITFSLCFLGNMFYGRSGLVLTIVSGMAALLMWNRERFFKILQFSFIMTVLIFIIYLLRNHTFFSDWYNWMSKPIINLITQGSFNNASFSQTREMVFMPEWNTFLYGDGYFTQGNHYYMQTDSGITRNILFWGLFGTAILYGTTLYSSLELRKKSELLWILILGTFLAFEYKGDVSYEYTTLFLAVSFIESMRRKYVNNYSERSHFLEFGGE